MREHVPLAPRTTLGVGGDARFFLEAESEEQITGALAWARTRDLPVVVLGGGSNLLVADRGLDALVLRVRPRGVDVRDLGGNLVRVTAAAGEPWDALVERVVHENLAGLECLSGIPGDVGATPIQNVGAYGQEVAETIASVRVVDRASGVAADLTPGECAFGYRDSVFKREAKDRYVVVSVAFDLQRGAAPKLRYPELERAIHADSPSLIDVRRVVRELRAGKSMHVDQGDENGRSAGSFFMNPLLSLADADAVLARATEAGALALGAMPRYPAPGGQVKLSAAWLIERAGFMKGASDGAVGLSTKHALAIVNRGGATASAIVAFALRVQGAVRERFGVRLAPEPVLLGFSAEELGALTQCK